MLNELYKEASEVSARNENRVEEITTCTIHSSNSLKAKHTHKATENVSFTQSKADFWMCIHFIIEELPCDSTTGVGLSFSNLLKTWTRKASCSGETIWSFRSLE